MSDIERKKLQRQAINRRAYLKRIKNNIKNYSKNFETDDNNIKFINRLSNNYKNDRPEIEFNYSDNDIDDESNNSDNESNNSDNEINNSDKIKELDHNFINKQNILYDFNEKRRQEIEMLEKEKREKARERANLILGNRTIYI